MGHRLGEGYEGPCRNFHGHNYRCEVELTPTHPNGLNSWGMVVDFGDVRRKLKAWIDEVLDHTMCLPCHENIEIIAFFSRHACRFFCMPASYPNPTAENLAIMLADTFQDFIRTEYKTVAVSRVTVWETNTSSATWSNSHEDK